MSNIFAKGIDVSFSQHTIDWQAVGNSGLVEFTIVRCGIGGNSGTYGEVDAQYDNNVTGAKAAGIPIGAYFYNYARSVDAAKHEAELCLSLLEKHPRSFSYPIWYDMEEGKVFSTGNDNCTAIAKAFMDTIQDAGYYVGLYVSKAQLYDYFNADELDAYDKWISQYYRKNTCGKPYGMWQWSDGSQMYSKPEELVTIPGISGNVDRDYAYKDYTSIICKNGCNGFKSGDVDDDGRVTVADARQTLRFAVGLDTPTKDQRALADVDNDGSVTAADAHDINREAVGLDGKTS